MAIVLVIDDQDDIRALLRIILEAEGHECIEAPNARAGLEALFFLPDAIFCDVAMPDMTGAQFLIELRQHPTRGVTPVTFVTAHADRVKVFAQHGIAEKIVTKPFRRQEIVSALNAMLGTLKSKNLRVKLEPGELAIRIDGKAQGTLVRLSQTELRVRGGERFALASRHTIELSSHTFEAVVVGVLGNEVRFHMPKADLKKFIVDAHEDVRNGERIPVAAAINWRREGGDEAGFLRDLSPSGAYVVTDTKPAVGETVHISLPFKTNELRAAEAKVMRHGPDGFGCMFIGGDIEFFVALNALLSDGTIVSGVGG